MFISTLVLNGYKLSGNFGSVVILNFMPSHRLALASLDDSSPALMKEVELDIRKFISSVWILRLLFGVLCATQCNW